jgi:enolase
MAIPVAAAKVKSVPLFKYIAEMTQNKPNLLPVPSMNVINGGQHADNNLDIQEHMILPVGAESFKDSVRMGSEVYFELKRLLKERYGAASINVGDEGGFAPPIAEANEALDVILDAIQNMNYTGKIKLGLDCAASEFYNKENNLYTINKTDYTSDQLIDYYGDLIQNYPIISIEDPFDEDDWVGFSKFTERFGDKVQIVGDDLFVTNVERLKKGIDTHACNCLLLKVNQIGSVTEANNASKLAFTNGYKVMVSHRSGETEDSFIADLVVGLAAGQIKSGAPARSDRTAKYNQLLRIEEELGDDALYAGTTVFN